MRRCQILLTNDDGIKSPGLWAAAEALEKLGFVTVAAPREQSSGMGRSLPAASDGIISKEMLMVGGREWTVHAVGGSPAQAVLHGILEIMPQPPDLVVSGINYGENVGTGVTISGTVGATLEAASHGIPALALSLETKREDHTSYSTRIDFSAAAYFATFFARQLLEKRFPEDVDVLKVDVPSEATVETPWEVTRVARQRYYLPVKPIRDSWSERAYVDYREAADLENEKNDTDVYVLRIKRCVSVAPLSLDMTSRTDFETLRRLLEDQTETLQDS